MFNNKENLNMKIKKRRTLLRVRNARLRALRDIFLTSSFVAVCMMCISIASQQ